MPPTGVSDAATRLPKQHASMDVIRRSDAYITVLHFMPAQLPQGPDPFVLVSKREWEKAVRDWRRELRALAGTVDLSV